MIILEVGADGNPRSVKLTKKEMLVKEVHERMMDAGIDQGRAVQILLGATPMSTVNDGNHKYLDKALEDSAFIAWLAS